MRIVRSLAVAVSVAGLLAACGGAASHSSHADAPSSASTKSHTASTALQPVDGLVATAHAGLAVFSSAGAASPTSLLPAQTGFGSPTTLLVREVAGCVGIVVAGRASRSAQRFDGFRARRRRDARSRRSSHRRRPRGPSSPGARPRRARCSSSTSVAVGSAQNPTPTGDFFLTDLLDTSNNSGAYGPYAFGLSAHSDTLSEFDGGDGQIGIHGTNDLSSIGNPVSHGCVRVPNAVVVQLASLLPLGTPVTIR